MNYVSIKATPREEKGKRATKAIRYAGRIPCVMYGGGENLHFSIHPHDLRDIVYSPDFKLVALEVDDEKHECVIREVQFHPVTENIEHVDFLKLVPGRPVIVEIPVSFYGVAPGLKSGGSLMQKLRGIKIKAAPEHLVDALELDISELNLGQSIRVRDIEVDENIEILNPPSIPVASVEIPRALRSLEEEEAEAAEAEAAAAEAAAEAEGEEKVAEEGAKEN
jgi:large subunit ribosomal protein L25